MIVSHDWCLFIACACCAVTASACSPEPSDGQATRQEIRTRVASVVGNAWIRPPRPETETGGNRPPTFLGETGPVYGALASLWRGRVLRHATSEAATAAWRQEEDARAVLARNSQEARAIMLQNLREREPRTDTLLSPLIGLLEATGSDASLDTLLSAWLAASPSPRRPSYAEPNELGVRQKVLGHFVARAHGGDAAARAAVLAAVGCEDPTIQASAVSFYYAMSTNRSAAQREMRVRLPREREYLLYGK